MNLSVHESELIAQGINALGTVWCMCMCSATNKTQTKHNDKTSITVLLIVVDAADRQLGKKTKKNKKQCSQGSFPGVTT